MTTADLRSILAAAGLPAMTWQLPDAIYEHVSADFVQANWQAWLDARPPELIAVRQLGGGKSVRVPRWEAQSGDCDNLALGTMSWADVGNELAAVRRGKPRGGLAYGALFYQAGPARAENFDIAGGHAINWFVAPDQSVHFFEPGAGEEVDLNPRERSSAWFGLAC